MDSLQDILSKRNFVPPDEVSLMKGYISRKYKSGCKIQVTANSVILSAPSSELAATLQLERQQLIDLCNLKKKLVIRTGR